MFCCLCIQACDSAFNSSDAYNTSCKSQNIDNNLTIYTWEVSTQLDKAFQPLRFNSIFTSSVSKELQPVYLQPHLYVRCTAQAVNSTGARGYKRTSEVVQLRKQRYSCYGKESGADKIQATITSYERFVAADQVFSCDYSIYN